MEERKEKGEGIEHAARRREGRVTKRFMRLLKHTIVGQTKFIILNSQRFEI